MKKLYYTHLQIENPCRSRHFTLYKNYDNIVLEMKTLAGPRPCPDGRFFPIELFIVRLA
jgi:hypothetical protein